MLKKRDPLDRRDPPRNIYPENIALATFASITVVIAVITLCTIAFWLLYPYKTIEVTPQPFPLIGNTSPKQGEHITYEYEYEKFTEVPVTVQRRFVDGLIFLSSNESVITGKGKGKVGVEVEIPETLPPGTYYIEIVSRYKVNPIRTVELVKVTEKFTVLDDEE